MNSTRISKLILSLLFLCLVTTGRAQTFPRLLLGGDYPDPSIIREGKDFYMTNSSFNYAPGLLVWHSTDLVNWTPIARALHALDGSVYAPDLVKYKGRYYIYYPAAGANYVVYADNIRGPWSQPVKLDLTGIDPGHVVGEDGKRYLYVDKGAIAPLSDDGLKVTGPKKTVYEGWQFPKEWKTEGNGDMFLEGPKLLHKDGYYYMVSAEGGTAGPATSHMVVVARSKSVFGPWENSPYNPLVHTYSASDPWWSKGHGTLIDDAEGNWWVVYHAYAQGYHTLGRQTLIDPVEWTADGWGKLRHDARPLPAQDPEKHGLELSDDFTGKQLGLQWTFWKEYAPESLSFGKDGMSVKAKGKTPADGRLLMVTATDKNYELTTEITLGKGNTGGLLLFYDEKAYAGVASDGKTFTIYRNGEKAETMPSDYHKHFHLRLLNRANRVTLSAKDGKSWKELATDIDVSGLHHNNYGGFYALRPALLSTGKGRTTFRNFTYRDATPQEKDMAAYLMVFHQDEDHCLHAAISRDGYTFTALNDGKPIIAGDTIADQKGIRDPHIYRGPDGGFYLAMTDLHIYAQRDGYRDTEWERDGKAYGWGNNRGLVLMKSFDLIHWTRTNIRFDQMSKEFAQIGCAWAPETVYDPVTGRMMIYFTMRFGTEQNRLYYVYVNQDFNRIESIPQILFEYPSGASAIDGDITPIWNEERQKMEYHLFYVAHESGSGIKQAVSDRIDGGYRFDPRWIDFEPVACEAPNVWKRIGEDKWVLMYDIFGINPHNFGFVETSDFVHFKNLGRFNEGVMKTTNFRSPKHGAVIHLTQEEADRLENYWNGKKQK